MDLNDMYNKLAELIEQTKNAKASNIKQEIKEEFLEYWKQAVEKSYFSQKTIEYYFDGIKICGIKPVYDFIMKSEYPSMMIERFLNSNTSVNSFKYTLQFFAEALNNKVAEISAYEEIMKSLINAAKTKDGDFKKSNVKNFEDFLGEIISDDVSYPNIENSNLSFSDTIGFYDLFEELSNSPDIDKENKFVQKISRFNNWLEQIKNYSEKKKEEASENEALKTKKEREKELRKENEELKKTVELLNDEISMLRQKLVETQKHLHNTEISRDNLSYEKRQLLIEKDKLENQISKLNNDIEEQKKLFVNVNNQTQQKADDHLYKIGEKLHVEYQDFNLSKNEPMNEGLGENYRYQLENIFQILKESGISNL